MKALGIKYQLRIITLIPVLLVAILFAIFYNGQYNKDLKQQAYRLGESYIRQLIPAAQFAMLQNNNRTLQGLINASTINQEIKAVSFYNEQGQLLAYRGGKHARNKPFKPPVFTGDYIQKKPINNTTINFIAPITIPKHNLYSFQDISPTPYQFSSQPDDILGWLSINLDTKSMLIKRYQMLIVTIFLTLLGLLIGLITHSFLARQIYQPISRLRQTMKLIINKNFDTKIRTDSKGELGLIENGCARLQQEYLDTIKDMNQQIEESTADLQQGLELLEEKNIQLTLEKKKSEDKSRQMSEFIANMSHEIRTPMNSVIGFTNVLLESELDTLQLDYVKTIKSSSQDLLMVINDILDYSKMDAGKLNLDCIPLDLRACIDEVLTLTSPNANKKGIDLIPITDLNVPKNVLGDPLRIKQIISNLLSNAIKFTDHGHVIIRSQIEKETDKAYCIKIIVSDTGIGISEDVQGKLFTAFNQADTSITRRYGGSGLGLVICKKLAEAMHGKISLESELHKGSTFSVTLKLEKLSSYEIEKGQSHKFAGIKVICFDDNEVQLESMKNGLSHWGVDCKMFQSLQQFTETLQAKDADYKIAFINVSAGNESKVSNLIQSQMSPFIVLTSNSGLKSVENLGADAFLYKPISMQKLYEAIDRLISKTPKQLNSHLEIDELRNQLCIASPDILIAEDNPVNRMLLNSILGSCANVHTAYDGEQAVLIANRKRFSIILLDLQMPKLTGLQAAQKIRQDSVFNQNTPILLLSAANLDLSSNQLKKVGIDFCLDKPIDEKKLIKCLLDSIEQSKNRVIDWPLCVQKLSGNEELAQDFLDKFIEELHKNKKEFIHQYQTNSSLEISETAHKLHGACGFCGVPGLQKVVKDIEHISNNARHVNEYAELFDKLISIIDKVILEYNFYYQNKVSAIKT